MHMPRSLFTQKASGLNFSNTRFPQLPKSRRCFSKIGVLTHNHGFTTLSNVGAPV